MEYRLAAGALVVALLAATRPAEAAGTWPMPDREAPAGPLLRMAGPRVALTTASEAAPAEAPIAPQASSEQSPATPPRASGGRLLPALVIAAGVLAIAGGTVAMWMHGRHSDCQIAPNGNEVCLKYVVSRPLGLMLLSGGGVASMVGAYGLVVRW